MPFDAAMLNYRSRSNNESILTIPVFNNNLWPMPVEPDTTETPRASKKTTAKDKRKESVAQGTSETTTPGVSPTKREALVERKRKQTNLPVTSDSEDEAEQSGPSIRLLAYNRRVKVRTDSLDLVFDLVIQFFGF